MKEPKITKFAFMILHKRIYLVLIYVGLLLQTNGASHADEYHLNREKNNLVKFLSKAPFEDIEGVTDKIDGYVLWAGTGFGNDSNLAKSEFYFEVELAGLDTGIGLRNRHMRDNYLEVDQFPYASYKGKITSIVMDSASRYTITCDGIFSIHGIEKVLSIIAMVSKTDSNLKVYCEFDLKLSDYKIEIPSLMFLKINETIQLFLNFYLKEVTN